MVSERLRIFETELGSKVIHSGKGTSKRKGKAKIDKEERRRKKIWLKNRERRIMNAIE